MNNYEQLPETVKIRGVGIPGLTATLVERTQKAAFYKRIDGVYEVFRIRTQDAGEMFGVKYPAREVYPGIEDFGAIAWCFSNRELAEKCYKNLNPI